MDVKASKMDCFNAEHTLCYILYKIVSLALFSISQWFQLICSIMQLVEYFFCFGLLHTVQI